MQTDVGEFELTPSISETTSLMTPNIVFNVSINQSTYNPLRINLSTNNNENQSTSNPSSIITTTTKTTATSLITSSADVKVLKIEDELKQSLSEPRRPTPSPFETISSTNAFNFNKSIPVITTEDGTIIEIPSTADIVTELDSLTNPLQFPIKISNDNNTRETNTTTTIINGENIRYDSPPTGNPGVTVSPPKKKFLIRSQSHTEPTSPIQNNNNNVSLSQKNSNDNNISNTPNGLDDDNSMDDSIDNQFTRVPDLPIITHSNGINLNHNQQFKPTIINGNEQHLNIQLRPDQNGIPRPIIKQQTIVTNNKRTLQQANISNNIPPLTKTNTIAFPQASLNEVTSTDQLSNVKRQRTLPAPINTTVMNFRTSFPSSSSSSSSSSSVATIANSLPSNGSNTNLTSDDQRKQQIRDSNREAARRCRERRRQYIEQLEGNLEHHKAQIKQLNEKLSRIERENTQLRAILSETKILHPSARLSLNDTHIDYANVMNATSMDLNSESNHQTDGGTIQRNYISRNNL